MRQLPTQFTESGFLHEQVVREENLAIYRRSKGSTEHYEVIRIRSHNGFPIPGTDKRAEPAEVYPRAEAWGIDAFTKPTMEDALRKMEEMRR